MHVECTVEEIDVENEETGREQPGVKVTCGRCDHAVESFGTGPASVRRCAALLREECPQNEVNFYVVGDAR